MGVVTRPRGLPSGAFTMLCAAGGVLLGAITASVSPGFIMSMGAFVGAGVAAESEALARPRLPEAGKPVMRTMSAGNLTMLKLEGRDIWFYRKAPTGEGTWPGVLVLHDGWGLTQALQRSVDALAERGFVVMALDLNNRKVAMDPEKAREMGVLLDVDSAAETAGVLLHHLKFLPEVGDHRVGFVGFGTGAMVALRAAMRTDEMSGVVVAYPPDPPGAEPLRRIPCPLLAFYGGEDAIVPRERVEAFRTALIEAGRNAEVQVYEKAGHAFMNQADPHHDADAAADAWSLMAAFLRSHL